MTAPKPMPAPDGGKAILPPEQLDDGRANRLRAARHLRSMPREQYARLQAEWKAGEDAVSSVSERASDELKAMADAEWLGEQL